MINEKLEVVEYLNGTNIKKQNLYRMCYLIAKYYRDEGVSALDTRQKIFEWANSHGLYIKFNLNDILNIVFLRDTDPLFEGGDIYFSDNDFEQIKLRFDNNKVKLAAMAILSYAKARSSSSGEFQFSGSAMATWIGVSKSSMFKYIQELVLMGFMA